MRFAGLLVLGSLAASPSSLAVAQADASDAAETEYRALVEDAVEQSRAGNLQEALALFVRAHELRPSARTLRGIGLVRFGLADYAGTIAALEASLAETRRPLEADDRVEAETVLERARRFVAEVVLEATPADARVTCDGLTIERTEGGAALLNPGRHELRIEADGHLPETRTLHVEGGTVQTLRVELRPESSPAPPPDPRFRLRVRSEPTGLVLHALPMRAPGELVPHAVSEVCRAPCDASIEPGLYRLAFGRRAEPPVSVSDYRIDEALAVTIHFEDRSELRLAGWIVGGGSIGAALALLATVAALTAETPQIAVGVISAGVFTLGMSVAIPLVAWGDERAIELRPLGDRP